MFCTKSESLQFCNGPAQGRNPYFVARSENSYLEQYHSRIACAQSGNMDKVRISYMILILYSIGL